MFKPMEFLSILSETFAQVHTIHMEVVCIL